MYVFSIVGYSTSPLILKLPRWVGDLSFQLRTCLSYRDTISLAAMGRLGPNPLQEFPEIECIAGHGVRDDRFFDYNEDHKGQFTFFRVKSSKTLVMLSASRQRTWDQPVVTRSPRGR